jgi:hypothetical protein
MREVVSVMLTVEACPFLTYFPTNAVSWSGVSGRERFAPTALAVPA